MTSDVKRALAAAVLCAALGCSGSNDGSSGAPATPPGPAATDTCDAGEVLTDGVCEPLLPASACAPGTRAALGSATCVPVGTTSCSPGFTPHASGWGCMPVMPAAACTGATREALGSTTCAPVGDCSAAFPPATATLFVDASLADAQVDATHFKSLGAAVKAAAFKTTIAVAPGTYAESLDVISGVNVIGRCAEKVILDAPAGVPAVTVGGDLVLSGITVRGGASGIDVEQASHVTLNDVVLDGNTSTGISATNGATVDVARSVIRGTRPASASDTTNGVFVDVDGKVTLTDSVIAGAADAGVGATGNGVITLKHSIIRDVVKRSDGVGGSGARVFEGATIALEDSAVVDAIGLALIVGKTKGAMTLLRSTVAGTKPDLRFNTSTATGASVTMTGTLDATSSTFADNALQGLAVDHVGSRATLDGCVIVGTIGGGDFGVGMSASAVNGAVLQAKSTAFVGSVGTALLALHAGSRVDLDGSLVTNAAVTVASPMIGAGRGGNAVVAIDAAESSIRTSTIQGSHEVALAAQQTATMLVEDTLVTDTAPNAGNRFGHGLLARQNAVVTVRRSVIEKSAGIGVAFSGATGSIDGKVVRGNAVGIHVQDGSMLANGAMLPDTIDPLQVFVTDATRFDANTTRVGSGIVPLPDVIVPSP